MATDKCIMLFLLLIVIGVIAIIVVKVCSLVHLYIALGFCSQLPVLEVAYEITKVSAKLHFRNFS